MSKIYTKDNKIYRLNNKWLIIGENLTEDYFLFYASANSDFSQYPSGFHLMRMSDHALRYLLPPWDNSIDPGHIYNIPFVRRHSVFIPNLREDEGGFWYSDNLGDNWTKVQIGGTTGATPMSIKVSEDEKHQIYIDRAHGVYVSNDYGSSWTNVGGSSPLDCGISNDGQYMSYADDDNGAYFSDDYGASFTQIAGSAAGRIDISYLSHQIFYSDAYNDIYEYEKDTGNSTLLDSGTLEGNYGFLSASYDGNVFLTGDYHYNTILFKDETAYNIDLGSYIPGQRRYGSQVSYNSRIMKQSSNYDTAISFDYGETWEKFDPNNFNTF